MNCGVEPIIVSSEARESCESVARALDIAHVRPEVLPSDQAEEVKRLRELEQENARLKKLLAERDLELDVMKEIAAKKW